MNADTEEMRKCGVIRIGGRGGRTGGRHGRDREEAPESEREHRAEGVEPEPGWISLTSKSECITTATFHIVTSHCTDRENTSVLTRPDGLTLTTLPPSFALLSFSASFPILNWSKVVSIHAACMNDNRVLQGCTVLLAKPVSLALITLISKAVIP